MTAAREALCISIHNDRRFLLLSESASLALLVYPPKTNVTPGLGLKVTLLIALL